MSGERVTSGPMKLHVSLSPPAPHACPRILPTHSHTSPRPTRISPVHSVKLLDSLSFLFVMYPICAPAQVTFSGHRKKQVEEEVAGYSQPFLVRTGEDVGGGDVGV